MSSPRSSRALLRSTILAIVALAGLSALAGTTLHRGKRVTGGRLLWRTVGVMDPLQPPDPVRPRLQRVDQEALVSTQHSQYLNTHRRPNARKLCAYAAMAASVDAAIEAMGLFQQLRAHGMINCSYALVLPERRVSQQMLPLVERVHNATFAHEYAATDGSQHWQTTLCPVLEWIEKLDVHVILGLLPFNPLDIKSRLIQV